MKLVSYIWDFAKLWWSFLKVVKVQNPEWKKTKAAGGDAIWDLKAKEYVTPNY